MLPATSESTRGAEVVTECPYDHEPCTRQCFIVCTQASTAAIVFNDPSLLELMPEERTPIAPPPFRNVYKVAAWVPVTHEILVDAGHEGPLAKHDPESNRWRQRWHDYSTARWATASGWFPLWDPPPWESPDPPALPVFTLRRRKP